MQDFGCITAIVLVVSAVGGAAVGSLKESALAGGLLGLFFGPFGVVTAALIDNRGQCSRCLERVYTRAKVCPHCGQEFTQPAK